MIVISMTNCPPKLRGDMSKWLVEINTGVYVGQVSARVREALWKRICENIQDGQATMVFNANNEQHMDFYVYNTPWKPVDYDGIKLMKHLNTVAKTDMPELMPGFSDAAKRRMAKKQRKVDVQKTYILLDIETTGLNAQEDEIIEIGIIEVSNEKIVGKNDWLVHCEKPIPQEIKELTGIDEEMLLKKGHEIKDVLKKLFMLIEEKTVLIYNAGFDLKFLEETARKAGVDFVHINIKDVRTMAKSRVRGLDNYKLDTVAMHFGIEVYQHHRAIIDCELLYEVYNKLNEN